MKFCKNVILMTIIVFSQVIAQDDNSKEKNMLNSSMISVTIGGSFLITGTFPAYINERVDQFVTRIFNSAKKEIVGNIPNPTSIPAIKKQLEQSALRGIILKRADGTIFTIDLEKFRINGNFINNPYLKNDDILIFPQVDLEKKFFSIDGAINKPGKYQYVEGDKISDAIELGLGINPAYKDVKEVEISRLSYDGEKIQLLRFPIDSKEKIEIGDRIRVVSDETHKKDFKVLVLGEVKNPGYITITKNKTSLNEIIERSGNFTEFANLKSIRIFNNSLLPAEYYKKSFNVEMDNEYLNSNLDLFDVLNDLNKKEMLRMSNITEDDTAYFNLETLLNSWFDGTKINLDNLENKSEKLSSYFVENGDVIVIPKVNEYVSVLGQVKNVGYYTWTENKNADYYLNLAGGKGLFATDDIMLIKENSKEWIEVEDNNYTIEKGDILWIPRKSTHSFNYYVDITGKYLGIFGSLATIVLLITQLTK